MSAWRVERHYGFGAAQIPIQPEPHRAMPIGLAEGVGSLLGELTEGGVIATMRRAAGEASTILLCILILAAVVVTLARDHSDVSSIEVVLLETVAPEPQPILEEFEQSVPIPAPVEIAKSEPPKRVAPKPPPPPQQIAERPKPPPPPIVKPKPRPKPVIPQIAKVDVPKPPPVRKLDRAVRDRPQPIARPRVAIDVARSESRSLAAQTQASRMDRIARTVVDRTRPIRTTPRMDAPAAPALNLPEQAPPKQAFRVASAKPAPGHRPRALPGIAPAPPRHTETRRPPSDPRPLRRSVSRPPSPRPTRGRAPKLSSAPVPMGTHAPVGTPKRSARLAPTTPSRRAPRPTAQVARASRLLEPTMPPTPASRSGREAPLMPRGSVADRTGVAGVPLGDLAACLSDREEDRLKQAVVAAVTTQEECVSSKGTYRFVETKNLNAFLMWIDRAPARPVSDRCVELGYALECLQSASRRAAR